MKQETTKIKDRPMFNSYRGGSFEFVRFIKPDKILVWEEEEDNHFLSEHEQICRGLDVTEVEPEVLKKLKIWNKLSDEMQKKVEKNIYEIKNATSIRMKAAWKTRKKKYEGIPRELVCKQCTRMVKIVPGTLVKKLEAKNISLEDYVKDFHCAKCRPTPRGRKKNPRFEGVPNELTCKCGKVVKTSPYQLVERADKKGMTVELFIEQFQCQKCNPTKGRKKK